MTPGQAQGSGTARIFRSVFACFLLVNLMKNRCTLPLAWLVVLLFLLTLPLAAVQAQIQAPTWLWAASPGVGTAVGTAVDAAGNLYVAGDCNAATFGTTTLASAGGTGYVAKLTSRGTYEWVVALTAAEASFIADLAVDADGNTYVTGGFISPTLTFGATTLTHISPGNWSTGFIAKLSPAGEWLWATGFGGPQGAAGASLCLDDTGHVFVTGNFRDTITFGATALTGDWGYDHLFVAKLSTSGDIQWAVSTNGGSGIGRRVAVDGDGNCYLTGDFEYGIRCGAMALGPRGKRDLFVAKLTPTGAWAWVVSAGGSDDEVARGLVVDSHGDVVVTGSFSSSSLPFGSLQSLRNSGAPGTDDLFVAKLTPAGVAKWAVRAGGVADDVATALTVDEYDHIYVAGSGGGVPPGGGILTTNRLMDAFVAALTPAGVWQWSVEGGGAGRDVCYGLTRAPDGSFFVAGGITGPTSTFGSNTLVAGNGWEERLLFARLSPPTQPVGPYLTLVPNPAHETVHLSARPGTTVELLDALGRVVRSVTLPTGTASLDVRGLAPGLYVGRAGSARAQRLVLQ